MVVKVKEIVEKTRYSKKYIKSANFILRGQRNARYHNRILSNKTKSFNFIIILYFQD